MNCRTGKFLNSGTGYDFDKIRLKSTWWLYTLQYTGCETECTKMVVLQSTVAAAELVEAAGGVGGGRRGAGKRERDRERESVHFQLQSGDERTFFPSCQRERQLL